VKSNGLTPEYYIWAFGCFALYSHSLSEVRQEQVFVVRRSAKFA
jgi:hypothetical protein